MFLVLQDSDLLCIISNTPESYSRNNGLEYIVFKCIYKEYIRPIVYYINCVIYCIRNDYIVLKAYMFSQQTPTCTKRYA